MFCFVINWSKFNVTLNIAIVITQVGFQTRQVLDTQVSVDWDYHKHENMAMTAGHEVCTKARRALGCTSSK